MKSEHGSPNCVENTSGWFGVVMIVAAYAINALGIVSPSDIFYIALNLIGSSLVGYVAIRYRNYQSSIVNLLWVLISIFALVKVVMLV